MIVKMAIVSAASGTPAFDVTADDVVRNQLWVVDDAHTVAALTQAIDTLPALYIADGHHRSAAAERVLVAHRNFTIASWQRTQFHRDRARLEADLAALQAAGLPRG